MTARITPERYVELLESIGLDEAEIRRATYAHCAVCGRQGYEHHDRDCGSFTPAVDVEEPVCECGAPTAKDCECEAEQLEADNDTNLGLRR